MDGSEICHHCREHEIRESEDYQIRQFQAAANARIRALTEQIQSVLLLAELQVQEIRLDTDEQIGEVSRVFDHGRFCP
jgi:hypothetical protein